MDIPINLSQTVLETERLVLRAFREDDLDDFYAYASVEGVGEAAGWPHHTSKDVSRAVLRDFMTENDVLALVHKADGRVIGSVGLHPATLPQVKDLPAKELGYALSMSYWGQGLMTEAARAVIGYAFDHLGLEALTCGHFVSNDRARRVIEKCGFRYVSDATYYASQLDRSFSEKVYVLFGKDVKNHAEI